MKESIDTLIKHFSGDDSLILLESQLKTHKASRFTYLAARPLAAIKANGNQIEITEGENVKQFRANPWEALTAFRKKHADFLFGYLGYDLKNNIEQLTSLNEDKIGAPDLFFMVPSVLLKIDHQKKKMEAIRGRLPNVKTSPKAGGDVKIGSIHSSITQKKYISAVKRIKNEIYEGEYYELNITHQLQADIMGPHYSLYKQMRKAGAVPFAAYLQLDALAVCCFSPERFLCKKGRKLISEPIKGTIKRSDSEPVDEALKATLRLSKKERAENLMIVDLVRNDLSRIAMPGSVKVERLFEVQTFPTVHQMVSTVSAVVNIDEPVDVIKACFPMGSMTGAPKVKVMQAIEELENYKRGIYSGAIGYFTPQGDFDFNVVIRTAIVKNNTLYYSVGGAITADSNPEAEWEESWLKAEALTNII